jgi:CHASE2 domain-containing sensor protein
MLQKNIKKHFFRLDALIITANIFVLGYLLSMLPINFKFLDPMVNALRDFDIYDLYYSQLRSTPEADTNIVLVNIGNLSRAEIAHQIHVINAYNPKVIALDIVFAQEGDPSADTVLSSEFSQTKNLVLVSRLDNYNEQTDSYDTVKTSIDVFNRYAKNGYANLPDDAGGSFRTIRKYCPFSMSKGKRINSLTSAVMQIVDSVKYDKLRKRNIEYEIVNYRGNHDKFYFIDTPDLFDSTFNPTFLKGKIVLMGFMGETIDRTSLDDIFFTPMNPQYAGRNFPDMYGVIIHANIISMILSDRFIYQMPFAVGVLWAFILCYLNVILISAIQGKFGMLSGTFTKLVLSIQTIGTVYVGLVIFAFLEYKINLTFAVAAIVMVPSSIDFYKSYELKLLHHLQEKYGKK